MKTNKTKTRRSHPLLIWMVLLFAMTNVAVLLEAERCNTIAVSASNGQFATTVGNPALYFASMAATIGSGLIILGAAVVWVVNFAKQVVSSNTSVKTAANGATKATRKEASAVKSAAGKTVKKAQAGAKKTVKTVKANAKKAATGAKTGAKKAEQGTKKTAKKVKKAL